MGLRVVQPQHSADLAPLLAATGPVDVGVVVAFGMILRADVLEMPRRGFLNVHFSLLPRWRGAAPVERAIMAGDEVTGVTIMAMDEGLDTGDLIAIRDVAIGPTETGGDMTGRLAQVGADLLAATVGAWVAGAVSAVPQPSEGATYAHKITPEDRRLSTQMPPSRFANTVRALAPEPGGQLVIGGEPHKLLAVSPTSDHIEPGTWAAADGKPLLGLDGGAVFIDTIQPPGKRPMSGADWLRGRSLPGT
jgi:methionyl-tRNA formyltransferase